MEYLAENKFNEQLSDKNRILQENPWFSLLLEQRITQISSSIPNPMEILFAKKIRCNLWAFPTQEY